MEPTPDLKAKRSKAGRASGLARAEIAAYEEDAARADAARIGRGELSWDEEIAAFGGPEFERWVAETKRKRTFDPVGWYKRILDGEIDCRLKDAAGQGRLGIGTLVPRPWQRKLSREIIEWRRTKTTRWLELVVKSRQLGFSTYWDAFLWTDCQCNPGSGAAVTAQDPGTLMALQRNFRVFTKQDKSEGLAKRASDKLFETPEGSYVRLEGADGSLLRGDAPRHIHVSEADYVDGLEEALKSALPAIERTQFATVVLETTIHRGMSTEFKDFIDRSRKGLTDYRIRFLSWLDDDEACLPLTAEEAADFAASIEADGNPVAEYERKLRDELNLSMGQIAYWRQVLRQDAAGDLQAVIEILPTSLEEALESSSDRAMFKPEAVEFYENQCCDPISRYVVSYDSPTKLRPFDTSIDSVREPHVEVWYPPEARAQYSIGADCADAEDREAEEGSENFATVTNWANGDVCAIWHGYCSSTEFALVLAALHWKYNDCMIVPEWNGPGKAVIEALRSTFSVTNIYQRQKFGQIIETIPGLYGFETRSNTRGILLDRVQSGINGKLFGLHSRTLLDHLKTLARNKGRKARRKGKASNDPDDGAISLGLSTFGHTNLVRGAWHPRVAFQPTLIAPVPKRQSGIRIEDHRENRGPVYDPVGNRWR